ncbi:hypothetical protein T492DRAFT_851365, partial [Pavlovales sp. CCMP2436]
GGEGAGTTGETARVRTRGAPAVEPLERHCALAPALALTKQPRPDASERRASRNDWPPWIALTSALASSRPRARVCLRSRMSAFPPSDLALGETLARKLARAHGIDAPVLQLHELLALLRAGSDDPEAEGALAHEHRLAALHLLAELAGSGRASADGAVGAAAAVVAVGFGRTATGRAGEAGAEGGGRFGLERGFALPPNSLSLGEAERFEAVVNSPSAHAEAQANGGRLTASRCLTL